MTKQLILLALLFVILPSADALYGSFKVGEPIELLQTCDNGITICDNCTISSIRYPNSSYAVQNVLMTKRTNDFNYTFRSTKALGDYVVTGTCSHTGVVQNWFYTLNVKSTEPGEDNTLTFAIFVIISILLLAIGIMAKNPMFGVISGFAFLGTGVYSMIYGFGDITSMYTRIVSFILVGLGAIMALVGAFEMIDLLGVKVFSNEEED